MEERAAANEARHGDYSLFGCSRSSFLPQGKPPPPISVPFAVVDDITIVPVV